MSELEQNKRINQIRRQLTQAVERIKTLELYHFSFINDTDSRSPSPPTPLPIWERGEECRSRKPENWY
ncbi:hypothetical protein NIES593_19795 [Hydrococcus rivularis NIES-593]|uniref:Uncharacterized protein n=1 Tax=Hydrococcus rivularis NIES-593 TaxID=1921803 RepID=A0A1U7H975_9CYAN|nr:hypothetical protein NIES593_19795 [Hydrococcus rivularis NIES-593]